MGMQCKKKITWTIKNSSSLQSEKFYSDQFVVGGCKWRLRAHLFRGYLLMTLEVVERETLPFGWRRHARYLLSIVNHNDVKRSTQNGEQTWFDKNSDRACVMDCLTKVLAEDSGFVVNGELKIVVEVEVLEVIGKLDVSEDTSTITESVDVNGFQLHSSQVGIVSLMFERHPEIASEFGPKNSNLMTGYMSLLISLIETLRQSPRELHKADLAAAYAALGAMTGAGFKLDWLEKKLDEMSAKKEKEEVGQTRMQQTEEELKDLKQKCSDLEAQLAKDKAEFSAAKAPISFDDVI